MNGRKALITGSSRGIGRALAQALGEDGYEVWVHCAGQTEKAAQVCAAIEARGGVAHAVRADLCNLEETRALCPVAAEMDVVILNASLQYRRRWEEIPEEEITRQLHCNFVSSLLLLQAAAPGMRERGWGRMITIGSVQEVKPHPDMLIYSASKAAQANMVRSLSLQLAPYGITVNNVAPGVIYTDRNIEALSDPVYAKKVSDSIPAGYYGQPEDLAGAVRLLCSDAGRYITGQTLFVDGGKSVQ